MKRKCCSFCGYKGGLQEGRPFKEANMFGRATVEVEGIMTDCQLQVFSCICAS